MGVSTPTLTRSLLITNYITTLLTKCDAERAAIGKAQTKSARGKALQNYMKCKRSK